MKQKILFVPLLALMLLGFGCATIEKAEDYLENHPNVANVLKAFVNTAAIVVADKNPEHKGIILGAAKVIDAYESDTGFAPSGEILANLLKDYFANEIDDPDLRVLYLAQIKEQLFSDATDQLSLPASDPNGPNDHLIATKIALDASRQL